MKTFPVLQSQMGVILENITNPDMTKYNIPVMNVLDSDVDADRLTGAIHSVLSKRSAFRTRFV